MKRLHQDDVDFDELRQALQIDESTSQEVEASVDVILAEVRKGVMLRSSGLSRNTTALLVKQ